MNTSKNRNLAQAKRNKNDEFYTRIEDIENELNSYAETGAFARKSIYLYCDKAGKSAFWDYFYDNFTRFGLSLLTASYKTSDGRPTTKYVFDGNAVTETILDSDGDFRSEACRKIAEETDLIVTNPPFSLFLEFIEFLYANNADFIVIGNANSVFCRNVFPKIQANELRLGMTKPKLFEIPNDYEAKNVKIIDGRKYAAFGNIAWYTTLDIPNENPFLSLTVSYENGIQYPKYDNYDAIEVAKLKDIPYDYDGIMGVPVSIIEHLNRDQFDLIWQASGNTRACCPPEILSELGYVPHPEDRGGAAVLNGKRKYTRVFIRHKR